MCKVGLQNFVERPVQVPSVLDSDNTFKLFIADAGANRAAVIRAVQSNLNLDVVDAELVVADSPGRMRLPRSASAAIRKLAACSCGCLKALCELGADVKSLAAQRPGAVEIGFAQNEALRFAQELRAAGAFVIVIDPAW